MTKGKPRFLLVEDEDDVRRSLQLLLRSYGFEVMAHASGARLAENPNALQADCLVADLVMPHTDGVELLEQMRGAGWSGKSILISGFPQEEWRERAREIGFDAWLEKPIANSLLIRTIERLLNETPAQA